jgi:hypothetical protein
VAEERLGQPVRQVEDRASRTFHRGKTLTEPPSRPPAPPPTPPGGGQSGPIGGPVCGNGGEDRAWMLGPEMLFAVGPSGARVRDPSLYRLGWLSRRGGPRAYLGPIAFFAFLSQPRFSPLPLPMARPVSPYYCFPTLSLSLRRPISFPGPICETEHFPLSPRQTLLSFVFKGSAFKRCPGFATWLHYYYKPYWAIR